MNLKHFTAIYAPFSYVLCHKKLLLATSVYIIYII